MRLTNSIENLREASAIELDPSIDVKMICAVWDYTMIIDYIDSNSHLYMQTRLHNMLHGLLMFSNNTLEKDIQEEITFLKDMVPFETTGLNKLG